MIGEWARVISPRPCNHLPVVLGGCFLPLPALLQVADLAVCPVEQNLCNALSPLLTVTGDDVGVESDAALHIFEGDEAILMLVCLGVALHHACAVDALPDAHTLEELVIVLLGDLTHVYSHRVPDEGFGDGPLHAVLDLVIVLYFADVPIE